MTLVDSSVWIDYFRGKVAPETDKLDALLGHEALLSGDLIVAEVLQGFSAESEFNVARQLMTGHMNVVSLVGTDNAVQAARNYRELSARGVTIRKTIDTLIATYCIENGVSLLYSDRDFDPFVQHLGLRSALLDD
ncbi:MAG: PIN domain nuclease [Burkholderia contaminans]|uniref:type II toxin-antitoxin system VapC family toxin n=1 Tax=Burkholderia TaxID=32008 RepID=UPI000CFF3279|nr:MULTISPECIES: PIN domain nuclease [Burkholderia]MBD1413665.1 PIN domain nuclease [Burkholderia contaminans]MBH9669242.1 PIN domain nuclease [Burkholderia contaminans]MBH9676226.1 PIN domain nuclease [Burkholderia contaminans]MBH9706650.1 PIN domain nuclease [Burkholderia contaminans]MBM6425775.1 PIN domain nuclease [Burkholderia contaminans]